MRPHGTVRKVTRIVHVLVLVLASTAAITVMASDSASESDQLAALLRQLDLLERLADQSEHAASTHDTRYHFDYARLHADIARMRSGIKDHLSPPRAQPRDLQALDGAYRRDATSP